ncbi:MAG: carbonic anhydrase [Chlamydiae bacterium]|nr:hypothetical protein [Chlamydiales bacterium]MCH9704240.1 carbonic anhydrase [Chlamydiota bacterium]
MKALLFFLLPVALFGSPALDRLKEGNERFISGNLKHPHRDEERLNETKLVQKPFACILTCADSRVSPEIVFDEGIGDLFVVRLAGNVAGNLGKESITFAAKALGCEIIVVMGHERCGAVAAVMEGNTGLIPSTARLIRPAVKEFPDNLERAIEANARNQKKRLQKLPKLQDIEIIPAYYNLASGRVDFLEAPRS